MVEGSHRRRTRVRDRPREIPRSWPRTARTARAARRARAVGHRRARFSTPCSRCVIACAYPRAAPRASRSGPAWPATARNCSTSPTSIAIPMRERAPPRWRGPRGRCSCVTSASTRRRPSCSSNSPATSCSPTPRRVRRPTRSSAARPDPPGCGRNPSPAICPSCCCGSMTWTTSCQSASCCRPTNTGESSAWRWTWSSSTNAALRTSRICRWPSRRRCAPASRARASPARTRAAKCSCCAPTSSRRKRARCCGPWRASSCRADAAASPNRWSACSRCRPPHRDFRDVRR